MTEEKEAPGAAAGAQPEKDDGNNKDNNNNNNKKKKRVVVQPPCPSCVASGYALLRGIIMSIVGANYHDCQASVFQPTYIKDKAMTGKFGISLGKKLGCGEIELPTEQCDIDTFYNAIETAANRIINNSSSSSSTVRAVRTSKKLAVLCFGNNILDQSFKKVKDDDLILIVFIKDLVLCAMPSMVKTIAPISSQCMKSITLDRGNIGCNITAGKKARKAEVTLKFQVEIVVEDSDESIVDIQTADTEDALLAIISKEDIISQEQTKIRLVEGEALKPAPVVVVEQEEEATGVDANQGAEQKEEEEMVVTAWEVQGKIDYNKLVDKFGSTLITDELLKRLEEQTVGKGRVPYLHRFLRRGTFFSHRDLDTLLTQIENGGQMYLYTGRGPSSTSMHLGHLIPFLFTKWLQDAFNVPLVIQMTDDEKFLFKGVYEDGIGDNLNHFAKLTLENARDIIACGFDYEKTFIFSDLDYVGTMYPNIVRIWKAVTTNTVNGIFGFDGSSNIGKIAFPAIQAAPSFASSFPIVLDSPIPRDAKQMCLIPCAIDQDPYFRMTRDVAHKLVGKNHALGGKPSLIHSKFFPPLQGSTGKMSSSDSNSAIFLTDTAEEIERKIKEHAFSGGQDTKAKQEKYGADLDVDVSYQWLKFFLEDDNELEQIGKDYSTGSGTYWSTNIVKQKLITILQDLVAKHQQKRSTITDEEVYKWMKQRNISTTKKNDTTTTTPN